MNNYKLKDICYIEKGNIGISKAIPGKFPLVITAEKRSTHNEYHFDRPSVIVPLVSSTGHGHASIKRLHYQEGKFSVGSILAVMTPIDPRRVTAKYLYIYLSLNKDSLLVSQMKGAANVTLSIAKLNEVSVPIPSVNQQNKVIEKYEKYNEFLKKSFDNIKERDIYISSLKQRIIDEAIVGKITAVWRLDNPDTKPRDDLLITTNNNDKGKKGINRQAVLNPIATPFEIPAPWVWVKLGDVSDISGGKRLPAGHGYSTSTTNNIYVRVTDMKDHTLSDENLVYISDETKRLISNYTISSNDLYVTIAGTTGYVGVVPEKFNNMNLTENAAKITPRLVDKDYLMFLLSSSYVQDTWNKRRIKAVQPKLALYKIKEILIPIPPRREQQQIRNRIRELMKTLDNASKVNASGSTIIESLAQAYIKDAFVE